MKSWISVEKIRYHPTRGASTKRVDLSYHTIVDETGLGKFWITDWIIWR